MKEDDLNEDDFFSPEEVYMIMLVVNEKLNQVFYHYWVNSVSKEKLEILDFIEFVFKSGNRLILSSGQEIEGIKPLTHFDFAAKNEELEISHQGLIKIESKEMTKTAIWRSCMNKDINPSFLQHDKRQLNDNLVFHFDGAPSVEIFLELEGLEVEVFTE